MRYHWAHQLMNLHFLIVGYLFYSLVAGVDRPPRPLPYIGKLALVLAAMPFHAFFGVIVFTSTSIIGDEFYKYIDIPWMHDLHQDQSSPAGSRGQRGSSAHRRRDRPDHAVDQTRPTRSQTLDRHLDQGLDDSYEAYNEMLAQLAKRNLDEPATSANRSDQQ